MSSAKPLTGGADLLRQHPGQLLHAFLQITLERVVDVHLRAVDVVVVVDVPASVAGVAVGDGRPTDPASSTGNVAVLRVDAVLVTGERQPRLVVEQP